MRNIKKINELYDDFTQSISKDELKNIMNRKVWDKIHKNSGKKVLDIPFDMKDNLGSNDDRYSKSYSYESLLKKEIPYLNKFILTEKDEKQDFINLFYVLEKNIKDIGIFSLELKIIGYWSGYKTFIFIPYIERREQIKLDDYSYRTSNEAIVDAVETYIEAIKEMFPDKNDKEIMKKMEDYISDLKDGNIVSYDDADFIKSLNFFLSTNNMSEEEIFSRINKNIKMFDNYTKSIFDISIFEK